MSLAVMHGFVKGVCLEVATCLPTAVVARAQNRAGSLVIEDAVSTLDRTGATAAVRPEPCVSPIEIALHGASWFAVDCWWGSHTSAAESASGEGQVRYLLRKHPHPELLATPQSADALRRCQAVPATFAFH
jgi:hypothetical protein